VAALEKLWRKQDILLCPAANMARNSATRGYQLVKVPKYKQDPYPAFGSYNASYRHGHISQDRGIPTRSSYGNNNWLYNAPRTIQNRNVNWHWRTMNPSGHDLNNIPMFMDTMWRGGGPYHGNANKIMPGNYNGDWQGAGKEMMHFAFDRHNGGTQAVFLDHSVRHVPIKRLWRLKWHRKFDTSVKINWPSWMAGYPNYN
jgi:hypothetical protein